MFKRVTTQVVALFLSGELPTLTILSKFTNLSVLSKLSGTKGYRQTGKDRQIPSKLGKNTQKSQSSCAQMAFLTRVQVFNTKMNRGAN